MKLLDRFAFTSYYEDRAALAETDRDEVKEELARWRHHHEDEVRRLRAESPHHHEIDDGGR